MSVVSLNESSTQTTVAGFAIGRAAAQIPPTQGVPRSGRMWKVLQTKRTSSMKSKKISPNATHAITKMHPTMSDQTLSGPFAMSMKAKASRAATKALVDRMRADRNQELTDARVKREEKRKRRAENELKASQVQVIDGQRMKKMNKKQLRNIKRTRLNKDGVVEYVPAYS